MLEFLFENSLHLTHCIEVLAAVVGLFCLKKYKDTAAIFFIWIIIYLSFIDNLGSYPNYYNDIKFLKPIENTIIKTSHWWFTIFFDIIAVILFLILFQKILKNKFHKLILKYATYSYFILAIILIYFNKEVLFKDSFHSLYIIQSILIFSCSAFYFVEILKEEAILSFHQSLYFYISAAVFLWWLIVTPLIFYDKYFILEDENFILIKRCIYIFSNIFMYSTFIVGLIVSKPEKRN